MLMDVTCPCASSKGAWVQSSPLLGNVPVHDNFVGFMKKEEKKKCLLRKKHQTKKKKKKNKQKN